jgi:outer membrane protein assembly factor BamB
MVMSPPHSLAHDRLWSIDLPSCGVESRLARPPVRSAASRKGEDIFKRLAATLLVVPALAAATSTALASPRAQWSEFRYGPARVGFNPDETTLTSSNVGTVVRGWSTTLPGAADDPLTSPIISGSTVYLVGSKLTAVNTVNGHVRWQVRPGGVPSGSVDTEATPAIDGNGIFVAWAVSGTSSVVQDRSTATGSLVWSTTVPSADFTIGPNTPAVRNGLVYFTVDTAPNQWTLYALVESTGVISWTDTFSGSYPFTAPAVTGAALIVGLNTGSIDAFNPTTGARLWSAATPAASDGVEGIAIEGTTTYAVVSCHVLALSTATGARIFATTPPKCSGDEYLPPAIAYGEVYVESRDSKLYAINAATGAITWTTTSDSYGDPSVANHVVYLAARALQAFDASTGASLLNVPLPGDDLAEVDITGGRIYLAEDGGPTATVYQLP